MQRITYSQQLRGRLTAVGPGLIDVELTGTKQTPLGSGAVLTSQLAFVTEHSFQEEGTITFESGNVLQIATVGRGELSDSPDRGVRHGTAVLTVEGVGSLAGARGRITSNFLVSNDGAVTDEQIVVLFIDQGGQWK